LPLCHRHRRKIPAGLVDEAKVRHRQINASSRRIAHWAQAGQTPPGTTADQNPVQQRIIVVTKTA